MGKPILCLDFDGVLHSYTSGWQGAEIVSDPPVTGAVDFIISALEHFEVHIFSSRSNQEGGIEAMQNWLHNQFYARFYTPSGFTKEPSEFIPLFKSIKWPTKKPKAKITIDDRAITFTGVWPSIDYLKNFKPWNKK